MLYIIQLGVRSKNQRWPTEPTVAFLDTFSTVGNCSTFANGKEYNIPILYIIDFVRPTVGSPYAKLFINGGIAVKSYDVSFKKSGSFKCH